MYGESPSVVSSLSCSLQAVWAYTTNAAEFLSRVNIVFVSRIKHATHYSINLPLARVAGYQCSRDSG